jgi:hypothetical protein
MGTALAIIAASFVGDAIYKEVKNYKETGEVSRSAQNTVNKVVGKADLGGKLVEAIAKSILK